MTKQYSKKLTFMEKIMSSAHECILIHNNYTNTKIVPTNNYDLIIKGFNHNISLFKEYIHKIPNYLNFEDINIKIILIINTEILKTVLPYVFILVMIFVI